MALRDLVVSGAEARSAEAAFQRALKQRAKAKHRGPFPKGAVVRMSRRGEKANIHPHGTVGTVATNSRRADNVSVRVGKSSDSYAAIFWTLACNESPPSDWLNASPCSKPRQHDGYHKTTDGRTF